MRQINSHKIGVMINSHPNILLRSTKLSGTKNEVMIMNTPKNMKSSILILTPHVSCLFPNQFTTSIP